MYSARITFAALCALLSCAQAAPTAAPDSSTALVTSTFSFAAWVETIIEDPTTALTPEQAIDAYKSSITSESPVERRSLEDNVFDKRAATCSVPGEECPVAGAVACINFLASQGSKPITSGGGNMICSWGGSAIFTTTGNAAGPTGSTFQNVARGAGFIMDRCTRADNMVQGFNTAFGNGNFGIFVRRP